jgi:hypothetical protein
VGVALSDTLHHFIEQRVTEFSLISEGRKEFLEKAAAALCGVKERKLLFVCTHNSRRSIFGQVYCFVLNISINETISGVGKSSCCIL